MRNVWILCWKELRSYFVSPIAYLLLAMFALNVNEQVIRSLVSNVSVIGLFLSPMISMRLFAEEKRNGTIELLATSPIRDSEVILGKWLAALILYGAMLLLKAINFA